MSWPIKIRNNIQDFINKVQEAQENKRINDQILYAKSFQIYFGNEKTSQKSAKCQNLKDTTFPRDALQEEFLRKDDECSVSQANFQSRGVLGWLSQISQ